MEILTKNLALAAYIKMSEPLKNIDEGCFIFESEKPLDLWEIEYYNSCCYRHDSQLLLLRSMRKR